MLSPIIHFIYQIPNSWPYRVLVVLRVLSHPSPSFSLLFTPTACRHTTNLIYSCPYTLSASSLPVNRYPVMHLWHCFPLPLLALVPVAFTAQVPFSHNNVTVSSTNLIDALSSDPDYTSLLHLLQKAKLIPALNKITASTLFAPTNDAIERHKSTNSLWSAALADDGMPLRDNVQEALRQELFYHLLNETLSDLPSNQTPQVLKTLHYPRQPTYEPPSASPWLPEPGGTLGGEPQRLRIAARDDEKWVGVDFVGNGGVEIVKPLVNTSNGLLLGVKDVLEVPPDLGTSCLRSLHSS